MVDTKNSLNDMNASSIKGGDSKKNVDSDGVVCRSEDDDNNNNNKRRSSSTTTTSSSAASVEYKVYTRRHFVLLSYALTMFGAYMSGLRMTSIVPSYAKYHGITNELSAPPIWGVDSFSLITNVVNIFAYFPAAYLIDRHGLRVVTVGSFLCAVTVWLWYFSGTNTNLVLLANAAAGISGPLVSSSLLAISNRWYPPHERVKATAVGGLIAVVGAGLALMISPFFATDKELVDLTLLSCDQSKVSDITKAAFSAAPAGKLYCSGVHLKAKDAFCCYLPVDIPRLNLFLAVLGTVAFVFTLFSIRDSPPTPPAASGTAGKYENIFGTLKRMFRNQRFLKLSISDFLVSGPPLIAVATISRIFPAEISHLARWGTMVGIISSIPTTLITSHYLDKTKHYWSFTMGGYAAGTVCWAIATMAIYLSDRSILFAWVFLISGTLTTVAYICWQAAVLETKTEYVFEQGVSLEGILVASDRIILNLSNFLFVSCLPPERVGGAQNCFLIGLFVMILGCIPTAIIRDKFKYKRLEFDIKNDADLEEDGAISIVKSSSFTSHFSERYPAEAVVQMLPGV